ncbi:MAG: SAM-dependent methyltransferase [Anaerocolumna aminovalerica]|jgi:SAM-dependent methyltransferase|uniref:class I SAM-dependent methyltransferase n=1 Tax=Anaerocolumna aminovalerica TaxID=1527 RepID=UPI001C0F3836|nr:SAM-dependent methyltransferase [Anaerocolumna aminovalerica]MBU5333756.1 SAM-dependent methyltransferase [Anaerocolumna aminovalerica]MDU6265277.1 SAM-dependent methyltransferase [Anaerocolumna aminovalerica]
MDSSILKAISENLNIDFIDMVISNPPKGSELIKVKVRPVLLKGNILYQASEYRGKQIFHTNFKKEELLEKLTDWLENNMKQAVMTCKTKQINILISKKGKATVKFKNIITPVNSKERSADLQHNREKAYILTEGNPIPFLIDLGVMNSEGKIIKSKYDKFKQINRFLEFIEDILPSLSRERELTIIDFGCGKSYLTFAMYYYLKELKGYQIKVIGLDLKEDVIRHCNQLAQKYGYDNLHFMVGDIASYEGASKVDMVVTLHACDTATDYALFKAIQWEAEVILSVPCCQHELNSQIKNDILSPILQYGLIKERFAALATDALRAELLEAMGYKSQILEFIDMEHTPKNILIRGVRNPKNQNKTAELKKQKMKSIEECRKFLNVNPALYQLLIDKM